MTPSAEEKGTRFSIQLSESPGGSFNRLVIYDWFARGQGRVPPRDGNRVEILVDGEEAWGRVAEDLRGAEQTIQIATWMCRPDIELVRLEALAVANPEERTRHCLGEILEGCAEVGVRVKLLIWGLTYTPILDRWMRRWYWRGQDNIEVLEQDHKSLLGSHHQKTITIDGRVGYCGGMNLKENDWDTIAHLPHEPRRFPHSATSESRKLVASGAAQSPFAPRHDLLVRIEGPAVADLLDNFSQRWAQSVSDRRASWFPRVVDWLRRKLGNEPYANLPQAACSPCSVDQKVVQIVRTLPDQKQGILAAYERAIRNARRYIYIENQYFRSPLIGLALQSALRANPRLRLIVLVIPINGGKGSLIDPAAHWTAHTLEMIRKVRPAFQLTQCLIFSGQKDKPNKWIKLDVHAKIMVIDDLWLTVGSANINDRGFKTEGEINAVVLDKHLAANLRLRLMAEHLELQVDDPRLVDVDTAFDLWEQHATENPQRKKKAEMPVSRVHHFVQKGPRWNPFSIGSGIF